MRRGASWFQMRGAVRVALLAAVCAAAAAPASKYDHFTYPELSKAPARFEGMQNPLSTDPSARRAGEKLFAMRCAECHGERGVGTSRAPSLQAEAVQQASPGALFWLISNGVIRRGMPGWSKLPEPQRWAIVAYLKGLEGLRPRTGDTEP